MLLTAVMTRRVLPPHSRPHLALCRQPDSAVTSTPQDIDDAMKLGFNWQRGPFEMIDAIGTNRFAALLDECGLSMLAFLTAGGPVYEVRENDLTVRHADGARHPVNLPAG